MRFQLKQEITYWAKATLNDHNEPTFGTPTLLRGRWEDRSNLIRLPSGQEIMSKSIVWTESEVEIGGYLAQGDLTSESNPIAAAGVEIKDVAQVPSLRTNQTEYRAFM